MEDQPFQNWAQLVRDIHQAMTIILGYKIQYSCNQLLQLCSHHASDLTINMITVVWEKFNGGNFHVKKFRVKIFSSPQVADEIFSTVNNYSVEIFPTCFTCVIRA